MPSLGQSQADTGNSISLDATPRPFWSVMIPAFRSKESYLRDALESAMSQGFGPDQMQIHVVDDCSPDVDVQEMVRKIGGGRVEFSRLPKNAGLCGCWNDCISKARGEWLHMLHQDDYVLPGFYQKLRAAATKHPGLALLAARSFFINEEGTVWKISERIPELEAGGRNLERFFYGTPVQCPGVVVKTSFYQKYGGFHPELSFTVDCEMWARAIGEVGGLVLPDALACYRTYGGGTTTRLERTAENVHDIARLNAIFEKRYPAFDSARGLRRACYRAKEQADSFTRSGDAAATKANLDFWNTHATPSIRFRRGMGNWIRKFKG